MAAPSVAVRSIPWKRILATARVALRVIGDDIPAKDRKVLRDVVAKSKGDPRKLAAAERAEVVRILRQVDLAKLRNELARDAVTRRLLRG